jgi:hypothetical protein
MGAIRFCGYARISSGEALNRRLEGNLRVVVSRTAADRKTLFLEGLIGTAQDRQVIKVAEETILEVL